MRAQPRGPRRPEAVELAELARLLPAPGNPDLPADRRRELKERFMEHIELAGTAAQSTSDSRAARGRPRLRWLVWGLGPLTAAALVVAVVLAMDGTRPTSDPDSPAAQLLGRVALAAEEQHLGPVRDDQYVYVDSSVAFGSWASTTGGKGVTFEGLDPLHRRQTWLSVDGSREGWLVEQAYPGDTRNGSSLDPNRAPSLNRPTYRYLETLTTNPRDLLDMIYAKTKGAGTSPDQEAFTTIGDLLRESLTPPRLNGALYRAAALIPEVKLIDDAVDAAGRHGVAVAHVDRSGRQDEWIFDKRTLEFLGEREVMVRTGDGIKAGTVLGTTAVLNRAIVDKINQIPDGAN